MSLHSGTKKRKARRALRELCAKTGQHRWKGDRAQKCEVCDTPKP